MQLKNAEKVPSEFNAQISHPLAFAARHAADSSRSSCSLNLANLQFFPCSIRKKRVWPDTAEWTCKQASRQEIMLMRGVGGGSNQPAVCRLTRRFKVLWGVCACVCVVCGVADIGPLNCNGGPLWYGPRHLVARSRTAGAVRSLHPWKIMQSRWLVLGI